MTIARRSIFKLVAATPFAAMGVKAVEEKLTLEAFLEKATPAEKARYHSNALMEAMIELHPQHSGWKATINHQHAFAMVVPGYDGSGEGV